MRTSIATAEVSSIILLIEDIDFFNFEVEFQELINTNPEFLSQPIMVQFSQNIEMAIPELSIFIDSLKDMGVFISGIITDNKGTERFARQLAIPNFNSLQYQLSQQPSVHTSQDYVNDPKLSSAPPKLSGMDNQRRDSSQHQAEQAYQSSYQPINDTQSMTTHDTQQSYNSHNESTMASSTTASQDATAAPSVPPVPSATTTEVNNDKPVAAKHSTDVAPLSIDPSLNNGLTYPQRKPSIVKENIPVGQAVKYEGDVVVLGEVGAGAILSATGSIHCYSRVDGVLLAGSSGNANARIYAIELNAEAIALSGYYAKRHQYKHILGHSNLMISLNQSDLNFTVIQRMPITINTVSPKVPVAKPQESVPVAVEKTTQDTTLPKTEEVSNGQNVSNENHQSPISSSSELEHKPTLFDDAYSSSVLSSLEELPEQELPEQEQVVNTSEGDSALSEPSEQSQSPSSSSPLYDGITPPLGR